MQLQWNNDKTQHGAGHKQHGHWSIRNETRHEYTSKCFLHAVRRIKEKKKKKDEGGTKLVRLGGGAYNALCSTNQSPLYFKLHPFAHLCIGKLPSPPSSTREKRKKKTSKRAAKRISRLSDERQCVLVSSRSLTCVSVCVCVAAATTTDWDGINNRARTHLLHSVSLPHFIICRFSQHLDYVESIN